MPSTHQSHQPGHRHGSTHVHQAHVLDYDAEVLAEHLATVVAWLPLQAAPTRIVDLGAGTGAGTFALLAHFPRAHLTAVDSSATHLDLVRARAHAAALDDRVQIVEADLDSPAWPDLGHPDLVWASASLHHLADPGRALRRIRDLLAPGGMIAVVELAGLPRFLPPTAPEDRPGLEDRCHAVLEQQAVEQMPHRGADWGPLLIDAGFTVEDSLTLDLNVASAPGNAVGAYAVTVLQGVRAAVAGRIPDDDLVALDRLLDPADPHSLLRRPDLAVRSTRRAWAARTPSV